MEREEEEEGEEECISESSSSSSFTHNGITPWTGDLVNSRGIGGREKEDEVDEEGRLSELRVGSELERRGG